jgi:hypothetical protein
MDPDPAFNKPVSAVNEVGSESSAGYGDKATRRLLRKIDFALIPFLALLYLYVFHIQSSIIIVQDRSLCRTFEESAQIVVEPASTICFSCCYTFED